MDIYAKKEQYKRLIMLHHKYMTDNDTVYFLKLAV